MKSPKAIILLPFVFVAALCCSPKEDGPNIRTMPGIEFCQPACDKMQDLYNAGDESCLPYIEVINVDGKDMNCVEFCEYEMNNSVQLSPQCIYEVITTCTEIPEKCED